MREEPESTSVAVSPVYRDLDLPEAEKRTVFFRQQGANSGALVLVNQPKLPAEFCHHFCHDVHETFQAIRTMVVRGAPAIGVAGAYGMVLAAMACKAESLEGLVKALEEAKAVLDESRPTAVNLTWATSRMLSFTRSNSQVTKDEMVQLLVAEAGRIADGDRETNYRMAKFGATVVPEFSDRPTNILHHCNTGALACVDWGTACKSKKGINSYCAKGT